MIQVRSISPEEMKYCSHCDGVAAYEIWFCNEKIVQQSAAGCLCESCIVKLKAEIAKAIVPNKTRSRHALRKR